MQSKKLICFLFLITIMLIIGGCADNSSRQQVTKSFQENKSPETEAEQQKGPLDTFAYISEEGNLIINSFNQEKTITFYGPVREFSWSSSGRKIAIIVEDQIDSRYSMFYVYHRDEDKVEEVPQYKDLFLSNVVWAPKGSNIMLIYSSSEVGAFKVIEAGTWKSIYQHSFTSKAIWSPDGTKIIFGSPEEKIELEEPIGTKISSSAILYSLEKNKEKIITKGNSQTLYFPLYWLPNNQIIIQKAQSTNFETLFVNKDGNLEKFKEELSLPFNRKAFKNNLPEKYKKGLISFAFSNLIDSKAYFWGTYESKKEIYSIDLKNNIIKKVANGTNLKTIPNSLGNKEKG